MRSRTARSSAARDAHDPGPSSRTTTDTTGARDEFDRRQPAARREDNDAETDSLDDAMLVASADLAEAERWTGGSTGVGLPSAAADTDITAERHSRTPQPDAAAV